MSMLDNLELLQKRVEKAAYLITVLRKEKAELLEEIELLKVHNEELKEYVDTYTTDVKAIQESVSSALDTLSSIEGLDDVNLFETTAAFELEAAENFTTSDGIVIEEVDLSSLDDIELPN